MEEEEVPSSARPIIEDDITVATAPAEVNEELEASFDTLAEQQQEVQHSSSQHRRRLLTSNFSEKVILEEDKVDSEEFRRKMWQGQSNILVVVRVRPLLKSQQNFCDHIVRVLENKVVVVLDPQRDDEIKNVLRLKRSREKRYAFDYVFDEDKGQEMVYNKTTKFLIQGVLDGFNATVFAYGQTGAGKTYTMLGTRTQPGIMVQTMSDLFGHCARVKREHRMSVKVTVSFLEVYNENIRDLLDNADGPEYLDLREDPIKGPTVAGITEVQVSNSDEIMSLLQKGNNRRSQHATAANEVSSRSHAVLQIVVETRDSAEGVSASINIGKLSLVDLAGSERAANTKNRGDRMKEGANINRSLLTLGSVINALGEKASRGQFVPYRDSKLTRLLKDSLGGNCRTVMIANISAAHTSFEETLNTLKYANRAKNIKTHVQRNVLEVNHHISEYVSLIQNLRNEVSILKGQLAGNTTNTATTTSNSTHCRNTHQTSTQQRALLDEDDDATTASNTRSRKSNRGQQPPLLDLFTAKNRGEPLLLSQENGMQTPSTDRAVLKEMKAWMQENFRERMQLRRTLIELEDQNVQNSIEIGKRQLLVANWNATRLHTPKSLLDRNGRRESSSFADTKSGNMSEDDDESQATAFQDAQLAALMENSPHEVQVAYRECEQLRKAIDKNNATKKSTSKRLRENERQAEKFHAELRNNHHVTGEERRELLELMYRIGNLELGNMELEQAHVIHESVVKGKDLTIQKLQLQLVMRDRVIAKQRELLQSNDIECQVGDLGLRLMEDRAMSHNFDTLRATSPTTPGGPQQNLNDINSTIIQARPPSPIDTSVSLQDKRKKKEAFSPPRLRPDKEPSLGIAGHAALQQIGANDDDENSHFCASSTNKERLHSPLLNVGSRRPRPRQSSESSAPDVELIGVGVGDNNTSNRPPPRRRQRQVHGGGSVGRNNNRRASLRPPLPGNSKQVSTGNNTFFVGRQTLPSAELAAQAYRRASSKRRPSKRQQEIAEFKVWPFNDDTEPPPRRKLGAVVPENVVQNKTDDSSGEGDSLEIQGVARAAPRSSSHIANQRKLRATQPNNPDENDDTPTDNFKSNDENLHNSTNNSNDGSIYPCRDSIDKLLTLAPNLH